MDGMNCEPRVHRGSSKHLCREDLRIHLHILHPAESTQRKTHAALAKESAGEQIPKRGPQQPRLPRVLAFALRNHLRHDHCLEVVQWPQEEHVLPKKSAESCPALCELLL